MATNPNEINIWFPEDTLTTRITGCFLRNDLEQQKAWTSNAFLGRRQDYLKTVPRAYAMTDPKTKMEILFHFERESMDSKGHAVRVLLPADQESQLINNTKYYYHPIGMEKCDPKDYDETVFVGSGYAATDHGVYLMSGLRWVPEESSKTIIDHIYRPEIRSNHYGPPEAWDQIYKSLQGGKVKETFIDRKRANVCWPVANSGCSVDNQIGYRKAPKWAITKKNESYRLSCRSHDDPQAMTWTWHGTCDPGMVVVPEINTRADVD